MKFSVIIPVFNKAETIELSINSIISQTISDFEIIVVDDGSTDNLHDKLKAYPSIKLIKQPNSGVSVARNTGINNASGEYVCFLDADDLWLPSHLEVLYRLIVKYQNSNVFITSHKETLPDGNTLSSNKSILNLANDFETDNFLDYLNRYSYSLINTNSICVKKDVFERDNIYFEPGIKIGEDTDVWYRLALKNKVAFTQDITTVYRREYSTATKNGTYTHEWIFNNRESSILSDPSISAKIKESVISLNDRYKLSSSRMYMLENNRAAAKKCLNEVRNKSGKRYLFTKMFTLLPSFVCKAVIKKFHKSQHKAPNSHEDQIQ